MRSVFAIALLGAVGYASTEEEADEMLVFDALESDFGATGSDDDSADSDTLESISRDKQVEFAMFAARNNKHYSDAADYRSRESNWQRSTAKITALNAQKGGARFAENYTADFTDEEFLNMLGVQAEAANSRRVLLAEDDSHRNLDETEYIDWVALDRVHPVKNQGTCGSCWAFAGTLALESMQAIEDDTSAVRLSE